MHSLVVNAAVVLSILQAERMNIVNNIPVEKGGERGQVTFRS